MRKQTVLMCLIFLVISCDKSTYEPSRLKKKVDEIIAESDAKQVVLMKEIAAFQQYETEKPKIKGILKGGGPLTIQEKRILDEHVNKGKAYLQQQEAITLESAYGYTRLMALLSAAASLCGDEDIKSRISRRMEDVKNSGDLYKEIDLIYWNALWKYENEIRSEFGDDSCEYFAQSREKLRALTDEIDEKIDKIGGISRGNKSAVRSIRN